MFDTNRPRNEVIKDEIASSASLVSSEGANEYCGDEAIDELRLIKESKGAGQDKWYDPMPWPVDVQPGIPYDFDDGLIFWYDAEMFWCKLPEELYQE